MQKWQTITITMTPCYDLCYLDYCCYDFCHLDYCCYDYFNTCICIDNWCYTFLDFNSCNKCLFLQ